MGPAITISGRYEILSAVPRAGGRSYHARHRALGYGLMVHFLPGNQGAGLLNKIQEMPEAERALFIDAGEHDGVNYVVSRPLPEFDNLASWVDRALGRGTGGAARPGAGPPPPASAPSTAETLTNFGGLSGIGLPHAEQPVAQAGSTPMPPPLPAQPPKTAPGEFTAVFNKATETARLRAKQDNAPAPPPESGGHEPGEFTKMFGKAEATPASPPSPKPAGVTPPAPPAPSLTPPEPDRRNRLSHDPGAEPGEFTKMFGKAEVTPASPPPPAKPAAEPGEFTKMFGKAEVTPPPTPEPPSKPAPATAEFTRLFGAPVASVPPAADAAGKPADAGSMAREIRTPEQRQPSAASGNASGPGEFTRLFSAAGVPPAPATASVPPPPTPQTPTSQPPSGPGEFTRLFGAETPPAPAPRPQTAASPIGGTSGPPAPGPSEFTRLFGSSALPTPKHDVQPPAPPVPPPPAASPAGGSGPGGLTRLFSGGGEPVSKPPGLPPAPPQPSAPPGGWTSPAGATQIFSPGSGLPQVQKPSVPNAAPPELSYTRVISSGRTPVQPSAPSMPSMPSMPSTPQLPTPPAVAMPKAPAAMAKPPVNVVLWVVIGVLVVLALAIVLFFVLRK